MADQKITQLTEDTSPATTDLVKTTKDPAGTPLDRKVTLLNLVKGALSGVFSFASSSGPASLALHEDTDNGSNKATVIAPASMAADRTLTLPDATGTLITGTQADAAYANKALDAVLASGSASLTDTIPNSLAAVQWGTEEAVIAQADCPASAVVVATLQGVMSPNTSGSPAIADRGTCKLQASFDGGGSWADIGAGISPAVLTATSSNNANGFGMTARATGTVTGSVQVRAMIFDNNQANDTRFRDGYIVVLVHPQ